MSTYGEFAYQPKFMTCDLTCYSDACNKHTNGLLVCRVHFDRSVKKCVSSSDLSTYYVHDLVKRVQGNGESSQNDDRRC